MGVARLLCLELEAPQGSIEEMATEGGPPEPAVELEPDAQDGGGEGQDRRGGQGQAARRDRGEEGGEQGQPFSLRRERRRERGEREGERQGGRGGEGGRVIISKSKALDGIKQNIISKVKPPKTRRRRQYL